MKYTVDHLTPTRVKIAISLDADDLANVRQLTLAKLAKSIKVPGFRKGKVPAAVAARQLDPAAVDAQMAEDAANVFVIEAFNKEALQPLERPAVDVTAFEPAEKLELTAEADVLPAIKLGEYKGLKVKKEVKKITDKEIDEVVENLRRGSAKKEAVEREARNGDEVVIDFEGRNEKGELVPGAAGKQYPLTLGSDSFIPGFEAGLTGKKAGEEYELPLTFPKDYHQASLAGAKVTFTGKVETVNEIKLPELNDEFAAQHGEFSNLDELKQDIRHELEARANQAALENYKNDLLEALLKKSEAPAPEVLVADQLTSLKRDMFQNLQYRGLTYDAFLEEQGTTAEEYEAKELRPAAEKRVQIGLLLSELSRAENIEVSQGELNAQLKQLVQQYPHMRQQLDTPEARRDIANRALTDKTLDRLVELNDAPAKSGKVLKSSQ
ncbi:trigger factor [Candidatus Saccharibacteria bacterium]|nr:trigger factor [Candidatus Saccharibacteria bacterium]